MKDRSEIIALMKLRRAKSPWAFTDLNRKPDSKKVDFGKEKVFSEKVDLNTEDLSSMVDSKVIDNDGYTSRDGFIINIATSSIGTQYFRIITVGGAERQVPVENFHLFYKIPTECISVDDRNVLMDNHFEYVMDCGYRASA